MGEYQQWTCQKCGHVNDPNAVRVSGMSFGRESFSDFVQSAQQAGTEAQERLQKYCAKCGADRSELTRKKSEPIKEQLKTIGGARLILILIGLSALGLCICSLLLVALLKV